MDETERAARAAVLEAGVILDTFGQEPPSLEALRKACERAGVPVPVELRRALGEQT